MSISKDELISIGLNYPTTLMKAQIEYSMGLIARDRDGLKSAGFGEPEENNLKALKEQIAKEHTDQLKIKNELPMITLELNTLVAEGKKMLREALSWSSDAFELSSPEILDKFYGNSKIGRNTKKLADRISQIIELINQHASELKAVGMPDNFIVMGREIYKKLIERIAKQKELQQTLPKETKELNEVKGQTYYLIKRLNRAGKRLYDGNPGIAAQYNTEILKKKISRKQTEPSDNKQ